MSGAGGPAGAASGGAAPGSAGAAALAERLAAVAAAVDGVAALYARPGLAQLARRVASRVAAAGGATTNEPSPVTVSQSAERTAVTLDVAVGAGHSGPEVARAVAAAVRAELVETGAPGPAVDVRVVAIG